MSTKNAQNIRVLQDNVKRYTPLVERKLAARGRKPRPEFVHAAAKYYPALKKLASG